MSSLTSLPTGGTQFYEGTWKSDFYPWVVAHGAVAAKINFETKTAEILLRYDGTFLYGTLKQLDTTIESSNNDNHSATATASTPVVFTVKPGIAVTAANQQNLTFTSGSITLQAIQGNYKSDSPHDQGTFSMKAISQTQFEQFGHKSSNPCIIC